MLLTELKMVEEEIIMLERKVSELNLNLCQEQRQTKERELHLIKEMQPAWEQRQWHKKQFSNKQKSGLDYGGHHRKSRTAQERRTSSSSSTDFQISSFRSSIGILINLLLPVPWLFPLKYMTTNCFFNRRRSSSKFKISKNLRKSYPYPTRRHRYYWHRKA